MKWINDILGYMWEVWSFRHEPEHFRRLADIYWRVLLILAVLIIVGAGAYGTMKLFTLLGEREGDALAPSTGGIAPLSQKDLQATVDGFNARAEQYELLKANPPQIVDPSR